jgi:hypothetical protein
VTAAHLDPRGDIVFSPEWQWGMGYKSRKSFVFSARRKGFARADSDFPIV